MVSFYFGLSNMLELVFVLALSVMVAIFTMVGSLRSDVGGLTVLSSHLYSSVFPFTVSIGSSRTYDKPHPSMGLALVIAVVTMTISCFNPSLSFLEHWTGLSAMIDEKWYLPTLLYIATFDAVSHAAQTSFNFEEVSLISHATARTLLYVTESAPRSLSPHEIFLPALTFGMLIAIAPAVPFLRHLRESSNPIRLTICIYIIVTISIFLVVRPWLAFELSEDPIIWVLDYMTSNEGYEVRLAIVLWWLAVLAFGIFVPVKFFTGEWRDQDNGESLNKRRKFFHGVVVLLFLPALHLDVYF